MLYAGSCPGADEKGTSLMLFVVFLNYFLVEL